MERRRTARRKSEKRQPRGKDSREGAEWSEGELPGGSQRKDSREGAEWSEGELPGVSQRRDSREGAEWSEGELPGGEEAGLSGADVLRRSKQQGGDYEHIKHLPQPYPQSGE